MEIPVHVCQGSAPQLVSAWHVRSSFWGLVLCAGVVELFYFSLILPLGCQSVSSLLRRVLLAFTSAGRTCERPWIG